MKNSKRSQIVVLIGLAISLLLSFFMLWFHTTGSYGNFFVRHFRTLGPLAYYTREIHLGLVVIALCAILYYIVFSKKKFIAVVISAAAIAADIAGTVLYLYLYCFYEEWNLVFQYFRRIYMPPYIKLYWCGKGSFFALLILFDALLIACIKTDKTVQQDRKKKRKLTKAEKKEKGSPAKSNAAVSSEIYCSLMKHVLLLVFTCGIWYLIWIRRMTGYTNAAEGEEYRNPTKKLLLCMFVPFYSVYWTYKTAQRVDKMAAAKGVSSDMTTLCLILAIFVAIVPPILLQDVMNKIAMAGDGKSASGQKETVASATGTDNVSEIKKFKELFDCGAITQEEFDAKKKQLLQI